MIVNFWNIKRLVETRSKQSRLILARSGCVGYWDEAKISRSNLGIKAQYQQDIQGCQCMQWILVSVRQQCNPSAPASRSVHYSTLSNFSMFSLRDINLIVLIILRRGATASTDHRVRRFIHEQNDSHTICAFVSVCRMRH
jgi:hypothetical protein